MTILTPTSNPEALPAGLPDVATLARLAGQFFATLPGGPAPSLPQNASVLQLPAAPGASSSALASALPGALPGVSPNAATGGTQGPGAQDAPLLVDAPSEPAALAAPLAIDQDRVLAQSFGLPGAEELQALLGSLSRNPGAGHPAQSAGPAAPSYYFVDAAAPAQGFAQRSPAEIDVSRHPAFDVHSVRRDFPILQERVNGRQLVWFDNAATTQKPQAVIERLSHFYSHENSNIHRAAHALAARATDAYEGARETVRRFLGASSTEEIIFVRVATEAINFVAKSWGARHIGAGDEIIVSHLEHHANIVPWQQLAAEKGARIRVIPVDDHGQVLLDEYQKLLNPRTRIVAVTQVSNALGTVVPVQEIIDLAHRAGARALVDGAQSVSHLRVDVQKLGADFFVFSGHKIFGPTGIGVVYGSRDALAQTPPWQGGGNMIADVTFEKTLFQPPPGKFEAGTGNIADAVGLGAALDYVERIGIENIARYEHDILAYATQWLTTIEGVRLIGTAPDKASVLSFVLDGYSTEEVGSALNREGIAVRAGHHCAQPILRRFGVEATVRPSLAFYNTCEEVDRFIAVIRQLRAARHA